MQFWQSLPKSTNVAWQKVLHNGCDVPNSLVHSCYPFYIAVSSAAYYASTLQDVVAEATIQDLLLWERMQLLGGKGGVLHKWTTSSIQQSQKY